MQNHCVTQPDSTHSGLEFWTQPNPWVNPSPQPMTISAVHFSADLSLLLDSPFLKVE